MTKNAVAASEPFHSDTSALSWPTFFNDRMILLAVLGQIDAVNVARTRQIDHKLFLNAPGMRRKQEARDRRGRRLRGRCG